ncbi:MAG: hypothetical protein LQ351_004047 [Letrouitia transgressa]|nr:MAG: hypothetical protein LQ351_004047 [Letrouitia transgressa]
MNTTIDALPNPLMSTEPTVALSSATAFGAEFDDYFSSLGSFPWLETPTHNISPTSSCVDLSSNTRDSSSGAAFTPEIVFPITENTYSNMQVQSNSDSRPDSRSSDGIESGSTLCSDSRCCCLETALGFLKDLSTNFSQAYTSQGDAGLLFPSVQSVIAKNRRTVEAIDSILQCFCSQDGYLLTILSLIAFRVLDWYAVAASAAPRGTRTADSYKYRIHKPSNVLEWPSSSVSHSSGSLDIDNEGPGRVAAQTVFDELYRAQRLVNKLSARVKEMETSGAIRPSDPIETFLDDEAAWPLLFAILDQLQKDLRKHLRTVSLKIVSMT